jgi:hypothetical protein
LKTHLARNGRASPSCPVLDVYLPRRRMGGAAAHDP